MDRVSNARIRQLFVVRKGLDERIDEGVLPWFSHVERMERDRNGMRVYEGECVDSRSVNRPRKRWITTVKERGLDVRQGRKMIQDRSKWQGFLRGNA